MKEQLENSPKAEQKLSPNPLLALGTEFNVSAKKIEYFTDPAKKAGEIDPQKTVEVLDEIAKGLNSLEPNGHFSTDLKRFVDGTLEVWPKIRTTAARSEIDAVMLALFEKDKRINSLHSAEMLIAWRDEIKTNGDRPLNNLRDLMDYLSPDQFNEVGQYLSARLKKGGSKYLSEIFRFSKGKSPLGMSEGLLRRITDSFVEAGLLTKAKYGAYRLSERSKGLKKLGHADLLSAIMAKDLLGLTPEGERRFKNLAAAEDAQKEFQKQNQVNEVAMILKKPNVKVLFISEALFGHKDMDITFLRQLIGQLKKSPKENLPDAIVVSGLVQGGYQFRLKDQRATLSFPHMNEQFGAARLVLNELESLGVKVIYNMSTEDREICHNYTIEAMRMLAHYGKPLTDEDKGHVAYYQVDRMKQSKAWDIHKKFQTDIVFPYCLRSGRKLRSADEVAKVTGGKIRIEEYLMLFDTYKCLVSGEKPNPMFAKLLEMDKIPLPNKTLKGYLFTDDLTLKANIAGKEENLMVKHNFKFGAQPMYQNPVDAAIDIAGQISANFKGKSPRALVIEHQQQGVGIIIGDTTVISTPGFLKPDLNQRGTLFSVSGDSSLRNLTTRRVMPTSGATEHEFRDDGSQKITFFTEHFLELASKVPDRTTLAFFNDWQNGSITARPDLQVKYADMVFRQYLPDRPVYLFYLGDIIQGRNYKGMEHENKNIGLVSVDEQKQFVSKFLDLALSDVPAEHLAHLKHVGIVPGNHEWNTSYAQTGAIHAHFPETIMKELFLKKGTKDIPPIKFYDYLATKNGEFFKAWAGFEKVAGHGVLFQHIMLEKGGKGGGDKPPIYQAQDFFSGMGDLVKPVDISVHGHWHFGQYALFGDKLSVVSPALAGISGFEYFRGVRSDIGATLVHLGGGKPVEVEFLTPQSLYRYQIKSGYFSPSHLKSIGFTDDEHFEAEKNGFTNRLAAHSALQKSIWRIIDELLNNTSATLG